MNPLKAFSTILKERNVLILLSSSIASVFGDWLFITGMMVYFTKVEALLAMSVLSIARQYLMIVLQPFVGGIVESLDKKKVLVWSDIGRFIIFGAIASTIALGQVNHWIIVAASVACSFLGLFFTTAKFTIIPTLATKEARSALNSLDGSIGNIALMIAPAIAAWFLAEYSIHTLIAVNSITFLVSAFFLSFGDFTKKKDEVIKAQTKPKSSDSHSEQAGRIQYWTKGFRVLWQTTRLRLLSFQAFSVGIAVGATWIIFPFLILKEFNLGTGGEIWYGKVLGVLGAGGLLGMFIGGIVPAHKLRLATTLSSGTLIVAFYTVAIATPYSLFATAFTLGLLGNIFEAPSWTSVQNTVAEKDYTRVFAVFDAIALAGMPLGTALSSVVINRLDAKYAVIAVCSLMTLVYGLGLALSAFKSFDQQHSTKNL